MNHAAEVFQPLQDDDPRAVGGYRLAARLGAGGMGRVYLSHTRGGRPVAIKVVRSELADDQTFRRRFGREIESARKVKGAYTAELIDADADGTPPWLATLYVPGPSLSGAVARSGPLPVPAVLWLMAGVAEALQAIHGAGIVHRDLKPSNVLLASDGPRVIDFGISVAADSTAHTATGSAIGTPQYMAPEQASGGDVTAATDIFSLGQTAAFAALGRPLYGDGPAATVLYRIVHSRPDLSGLPDRLRDLLGRCLAADPGDRATPVEVVEWCRRELGRDGEEEAGSAVWREIAGPPVTVPPPVAATGPATAAASAPVLDPTAAHTRPWTAPQPAVAQWPGAAQWPAGPYGTTAPQRQDGPEERKRRRRRVALITGTVLAAGALTISAAWTVLDAAWDGVRDRTRDTAASASGTPGTGAGGSSAPEGAASGAAATEGSGSEDGSEPAAGSGADAPGVPAGGSVTGSATPPAQAHTGVWLDAERSVTIRDGKSRKPSEGDFRFGCAEAGCELESDTSVLLLMYREPGTTYEDCRLITANQENRSVPLAAVAAGSEICVRHRNGDIALLVVQTKSTAVPELAFLRADVTVWRADQD
ncbi:protein kinase [Streptomyces sp. NPDC045251]|uniref:protein kinase domain-containing protein n=1 Tax=unclassified Streptomyces TaxID=2593676 RepID=UPI0033ED35D8